MKIPEKYKKKLYEVHGDRYDYSQFNFTKVTDKSIIKCGIHGPFEQSLHSHLKGSNCPKCAKQIGSKKLSITKKYTSKDIISLFKEKYGNKYDYSKIKYTGYRDDVIVICPKHGEFKVKPANHLRGSECKLCKKEDSFNEFVVKSRKKFGDKFKYIDDKGTRVRLFCDKHGVVEVSKEKHLSSKYGCSKCNIEFRDDINRNSLKKFIDLANNVHGMYDYSEVNYVNNKNKVKIICPYHGPFFQRPDNHLNGNGCMSCYKSLKNSKGQKELFNFLSENVDSDVIENFYGLNGNKEIDIYLPNNNLGIEYNGLYWHSELFKSRTYHLNKSNALKQNNVDLIHVYEHLWKNKKNIVKSLILNKLNITKDKIYARKCKIINLNIKDYRSFLENNHIQGYAQAKYKIGLQYNNEIVACMSFSKPRVVMGGTNNNIGKLELIRLCSKLNTVVIGGMNKMLKYFIQNNNVNEIISYCDYSLFNGKIYEKLGFEYSHTSKPNYFYTNSAGCVIPRYKVMKHKLVEEGYDKNKTEVEIMHSLNYWRVWDCGNGCYKLKINN